uniref:protease modulator HflC n=1 Tax=Thaumasiovibrio occultus TaxID=1891184 RepID=UPI000B358AE2|nr:protease modulator HflC [Thaumasiovibrio occultus]
MRKLVLALAVILVAVTLSSLFVVNQTERAFVVRFGRLHVDAQDVPVVYEPGLHFKLPFVDKVRLMDARLLTMDGNESRYTTNELKDVIVDLYVKWRIVDFSQYFEKTGNGNRRIAETLLQQRIDAALRAEIGQKSIKQIVSTERNAVMNNVRLVTEAALREELGIELVDVRIKQINLPTDVSESIHARMRAEREAVARQFRADGRRQQEEIQAAAELEVATLLAEADRDARERRGSADAEVARIYTQAVGQNEEFYGFLRSLSAYEGSFNSKDDVMILEPTGDFFRYMNNQDGVQ